MHRRSLRRHRDRLRRHGTGAAAALSAMQDALAGADLGASAREREADARSQGVHPASARGQLRICDLPDGFLPAHFAEVKAEFEDIEERPRAGPGIHASRARSSSGPQPGEPDHVADLSRPPDLGIRDSEVRRRSGDARTCTCRWPPRGARKGRRHHARLSPRKGPSRGSRPRICWPRCVSAASKAGPPAGLPKAFHCRKLVCPSPELQRTRPSAAQSRRGAGRA